MNNMHLYPSSLDGKTQGNDVHLGVIQHDYMSLYEPVLLQRPATMAQTQVLTEDEKRIAAMVIDRERIEQKPMSRIPSLDLLRRQLEQEKLRIAQVPKVHPESVLSNQYKSSVSPGSTRMLVSSGFPLPKRLHTLPGDRMLSNFEAMRRLTHATPNPQVLERALRVIRDEDRLHRDLTMHDFHKERTLQLFRDEGRQNRDFTMPPMAFLLG